jgi:hypothetical protein
MSHMNQKDFLIIGIITLVIFTGTYAVLSIFGFVPEEFAVVEEVKEPQTERPTIQNNQENTDILLPDRVTIPEIGVDSVIQKQQPRIRNNK